MGLVFDGFSVICHPPCFGPSGRTPPGTPPALIGGTSTIPQGGMCSPIDELRDGLGLRWVFGRCRQLIAPLITGLSIMPFSTYQLVAICL